MNKWVIQLNEQQLANLNLETKVLGELMRNGEGESYLVFRDNFVALKVARGLGNSYPVRPVSLEFINSHYTPS